MAYVSINYFNFGKGLVQPTQTVINVTNNDLIWGISVALPTGKNYSFLLNYLFSTGRNWFVRGHPYFVSQAYISRIFAAVGVLYLFGVVFPTTPLYARQFVEGSALLYGGHTFLSSPYISVLSRYSHKVGSINTSKKLSSGACTNNFDAIVHLSTNPIFMDIIDPIDNASEISDEDKRKSNYDFYYEQAEQLKSIEPKLIAGVSVVVKDYGKYLIGLRSEILQNLENFGERMETLNFVRENHGEWTFYENGLIVSCKK